MRCLEVAPPEFDKEAVERQLKLAWNRLEGRGLKRSKKGDIDGAIADFRRCLKIDPEMHWAAWLLATALQARDNVDFVELEDLCRKAVAWQLKNDVDASRQSYLLAMTLQRQGKEDAARDVAIEYLKKPSEDADARVLEVLKALAGS